MESIILGDIEIEVVKKDIKNVHLSVYPPSGRVRISAPLHLDTDTIRIYSISKLAWIKRQQIKLRKQKREAPRLYINRESHYFQGKRFMMMVIADYGKQRIDLTANKLKMYVHPESTFESRKRLMEDWYRSHLKQDIATLIQKWEKVLKVNVKSFGVRKMNTKWGACNEVAGRIWLNLELAKKPHEMLEYVIVHEMAHLIERKHNERFIAVLDKYLPNWRFIKDELNRLPIAE